MKMRAGRADVGYSKVTIISAYFPQDGGSEDSLRRSQSTQQDAEWNPSVVLPSSFLNSFLPTEWEKYFLKLQDLESIDYHQS